MHSVVFIGGEGLSSLYVLATTTHTQALDDEPAVRVVNSSWSHDSSNSGCFLSGTPRTAQ